MEKKISAAELVQTNGMEIPYDIDYKAFDNNPFLRAVKDVRSDIHIYYNLLDQLTADVAIDGTLVCPCALTLEDTDVPFSVDEQIRLSFKDEEDVYFVDEELDLEDFVMSFIFPIVPIKVVKNEEIEYPRGDGWRVMTEAEFEESRKQRIDPRLSKLLDLVGEEEE
ncbi:MAG: DUF177 domain-containing protein [Erysipelotrichaceae bacterium]|nr:DUF177 domain-containing protein [Erysipelotrichaceae bacterium]